MGRPKLDPVLTQRIVDLVRAGNYAETAATTVGIHSTTFYRWLKRGRDQKRGRYRKFLNAVEKAHSEAEARDVALIAKAAVEDWRAAAWRLERKSPRRYGPRVQAAVQAEIDSVLARLEKGLQPGVYEQVLQLVAAEDDEVPEFSEATTRTLARLDPVRR